MKNVENGGRKSRPPFFYLDGIDDSVEVLQKKTGFSTGFASKSHIVRGPSDKNTANGGRDIPSPVT